MFGKLLVPTDFSAESENALKYAVELASRHETRIVLLHICRTGLFSLGKSREKEKLAMEKLNKYLAYYSGHEQGRNVQMEAHVMHGREADEIIRYASKIKASFIVMGFKGEGENIRSTVGHNTLEVILRSPIPVMSIPPGCIYRPLKKIVYTNHNARTENTNFNTVVKVAEVYQSDIVILRPKNRKQEENPETAHSVFSHKKNIYKYQKIYKYYAETEDLAQGMSEYIEHERPDMVALGIHEEQFFERMVRQVYGKEIAMQYSIPLFSTSIG